MLQLGFRQHQLEKENGFGESGGCYCWAWEVGWNFVGVKISSFLLLLVICFSLSFLYAFLVVFVHVLIHFPRFSAILSPFFLSFFSFLICVFSFIPRKIGLEGWLDTVSFKFFFSFLLVHIYIIFIKKKRC